jgi:hypothetical protein
MQPLTPTLAQRERGLDFSLRRLFYAQATT